MCQLLGMNCNTPTDIGFSFSGFRQRGGNTDHHTDGFGIAFFEHNNSLYKNNQPMIGLRLYHDDKPSYKSPVADLVKTNPVKAMNVLAHIRKATQGQTCLANTHPFIREVWGQQWAFAHNGQMNKAFLEQYQRLASNGNCEHYTPVGTTDSELAFCYLLNRLKSTFKTQPDEATLFKFLIAQCRYLSVNGLFNCLLTNGDWHLAYAGSLLFYLTRTAPFGEAHLADGELSINFADHTTEDDQISVIVTIPLTNDEQWQQLAVNECVIFRNGQIIVQDEPNDKCYLTIEEGIAVARKVGASV